MRLYLWKSPAGRLKDMAECWMDQRLGSQWRTVLSPYSLGPGNDVFDVTALLALPEEMQNPLADLKFEMGEVRFLKQVAVAEFVQEEVSEKGCFFIMTAQPGWRAARLPAVDRSDCWGGTLTEQLYLDSWGTALLDCGRQLLGLLLETILREKFAPDCMGGPGLNGTPMEDMQRLYRWMEGWRIGVEVNDSGVLIPEKSCAGWFLQRGAAGTAACPTGEPGCPTGEPGCPTGEPGCPAGERSAGAGCMLCQRRDICTFMGRRGGC